MTRVAIVHDYLTQRGGAERVVLAMSEVFPEAPIFTALYDQEATYPEFRGKDVRPSRLNRLRLFRADHRRALPFLQAAFDGMRIDADVVITSSSGWAHGVHSTGRKIVYCYNPARWLYQTDEYLGAGHRVQRKLLALLAPGLREWDLSAASTADKYIAISTVVQRRIAETYGIAADLLPPPHAAVVSGASEPVPRLSPGFHLVVSRLLPYKNVNKVVEAFELLSDERVVVVGRGPMEKLIRRQAGPNVTMLGEVSDSKLRWLYENSRFLIAASFEDFGLTPLEANAFGKPAVLLRGGGFLDTGREGITCEFFEAPDPSKIAQGIRAALTRSWDPATICRHAERYDKASFARGLQEQVRLVECHQAPNGAERN